MPIITLPDGNNIDFPNKVTGLEVAEKISKSLVKQAMVISVDGELKDLDFLIENDCSVKIFTSKNPEGLETCLLYTSPSPRDATLSRMPSSA